MPEVDFYSVFLPQLNGSGIEYMVTGSMACIIYGRPRMTHDIDLVIAAEIQKAELFNKLFPADVFYCPPQEVIKTELLRENRGHFNLIHHPSGLKADIYPAGRDPLMAWGLAHRKKHVIENLNIWTAPPEYVIVQKLQYFREGGSSKHVTDICGILEISGESVNMTDLKKLIKDSGLEAVFERIIGT